MNETMQPDPTLDATQRALGGALDRLEEFVIADQMAQNDRDGRTTEDAEFIREVRPLTGRLPGETT